MELTHHKSGDIDILRMSGRFDAYTVSPLVRWMDEHKTPEYVVANLHGLNFMDSSGLAFMVALLKRCRLNEGDFVLCNVGQSVMVILELTRLDKTFTIFDNEASAIAALMPESA